MNTEAAGLSCDESLSDVHDSDKKLILFVEFLYMFEDAAAAGKCYELVALAVIEILMAF